MSSAVARIGVVVLALAQLGVTGFYAPAHRLLHHSLRQVESSEPSASATSCRSSCCHRHRAEKAAAANQAPSYEQTPAAPCPDDENNCVWCAIALQQAAPAMPAAEMPSVDPIEFISTPDHSPVAARPATAFDVRGPPVL